MDKETFESLARKNGIIGSPFVDFQKTIEFLSSDSIEFTFEGKINDVIARCYWADDRGNGGCISVPSL